MALDIDIDIKFESINFDVKNFSNLLPTDYELVEADKLVYLIFNGLKGTSYPSLVICGFLDGLINIKDQISLLNADIRLGLYYDLRETVVFPLCFDAKTIKLMSEFNLGLDATAYPCDEDN